MVMEAVAVASGSGTDLPGRLVLVLDPGVGFKLTADRSIPMPGWGQRLIAAGRPCDLFHLKGTDSMQQPTELMSLHTRGAVS